VKGFPTVAYLNKIKTNIYENMFRSEFVTHGILCLL